MPPAGGPIHCPFAGAANIDTETGLCLLLREPVQVGGHAGEMVGDDLVRVFLDNGNVLHVAAAGALSLSRGDLIRFAAGVHVTPYALPEA